MKNVYWPAGLWITSINSSPAIGGIHFDFVAQDAGLDWCQANQKAPNGNSLPKRVEMLVPITDKTESRQAFDALTQQVSFEATMFPECHLGHRGGGRDCNVYWHDTERIWGVFETPSHLDRFWICWGASHSNIDVSITVETNPPLEGFDRRCAGLFLKDDMGNVILGHTGRVGGGRKGIGMKAFQQFAQDADWQPFLSPNGKPGMVISVGQLGLPDLVGQVARFVHKVAAFKAWAVRSA